MSEFRSKFHSRLKSWEQNDRILPNFEYAFILTRSMLGFLHVIFRTFVPALWPLIYATRILFPLSILRTKWKNSPNLYMHSYWQKLCWDCYTSFFAHLHQSYGPWFMPKFCFRAISWEQINRILPYWFFASILIRSKLGLLHVIFFIHL